MQKNQKQNIAYVDGTNLHKGIKNLGEELDYKKFYIFLKNKYRIQKSYIFMGFLENQRDLYKYLENCGFELIFKESIFHNGSIKGNADSEMVLKSVRDFYEEKDIGSSILVTGDGDFSCLIDFLVEKKIFKTILIPNKKFCSYLIRKKQIPLTYLKNFLNEIKKVKKPSSNT